MPDLTVGDAMRSRVHVVRPEMSLAELEREFIDKQVTGFPVVESGQLVGLVSRFDVVRRLVAERYAAETTSDFYWDQGEFHEEPTESFEQIANRVGQRLDELQVKDLMNHQVIALDADESLEAAAQKLLDHRIHRAPVVEGGKLVGILSTLDLVRLFVEKRIRLG